MRCTSILALGFLTVGCAATSDTSSTGVAANSGENSAGDGGGNGGSSANGSGDGGTGSSGGLDEACASDTFLADLKPSALVFQLDTSGSMNCPITNPGCLTDNPTSAADDSRWDVFRSTLNGVLTDLPDSLAVGLMHFPNPDTGCAPTDPLVAIGALSSTRASIAGQLQSLVPEYITPTRDAVQSAIAQAAARSEDNRYVVLATDGAATVCLGCDASCANAGKVPASESDALVQDVKNAFDSQGIRTFVIGVPGSQTYRSELSRVAQAGGTARSQDCTTTGPNYCHYDLTDATVDFGALLSEALTAISGNVLACEFAVPTTTDFDPDKVNVRLTDESSTTDLKRDPKEASGWNYSADGKTIRLFGSACEAAKQVKSGKIDIVYGCPTQILI